MRLQETIEALTTAFVPLIIGASTIFLCIHQHRIIQMNYEQDRRLVKSEQRQDRILRQLEREEDLKILQLQREQDLEILRLRRQLDRAIAENESETRRLIERQYRDLQEKYRQEDLLIFWRNQVEDQRREKEHLLDRAMIEYENDLISMIFSHHEQILLVNPNIRSTIRTRTRRIFSRLDPPRRTHLLQILVGYDLFLSAYDQTEVDIFHAHDLRDMTFNPPVFSALQLMEFRFPQCDFRGSNFDSVALEGILADLTHANLENVLWTNVTLLHIPFQRTQMDGTRFIDTWMIDVRFNQTSLNRASFHRMKRAIAITLTKASMDQSDFSSNIWRSLDVSTGSMIESNLSHAEYLDGNFIALQMTNVNLNNSKFIRTYFLEVTMRNCRMHDTIFINSTFRDSDLTSCRGYNVSNWKNVRIFRTTLPDRSVIKDQWINPIKSG